MAIVEVKVPQLSESVAEATLLQWKKKPGDAVAMDEILIEIETDKVVLEVPAPAAGVLAEIWSRATAPRVRADELIARIDTEGKAGRRRRRRCGCPRCRCAGSGGRRCSRRVRRHQGRRRHARSRQADGRQQPGGRLRAPAPARTAA